MYPTHRSCLSTYSYLCISLARVPLPLAVLKLIGFNGAGAELITKTRGNRSIYVPMLTLQAQLREKGKASRKEKIELILRHSYILLPDLNDLVVSYLFWQFTVGDEVGSSLQDTVCNDE